MLRGRAVSLRPMTAADLPWLEWLFAVPEVAEAWPGDNMRSMREMVEGADPTAGFVVACDGEDIGFIQYYEEADPDYSHAGIDIVLHPDRCDRGLGTDALRTLARHLFDERGHHRIMIDPHVGNARAIASYRKVGFRDVGVMRRYERANDGVWRDALLMDLLAGELQG